MTNGEGETATRGIRSTVLVDTQAPDVADRELVARAREGDVRAFETLYRRTIGRVYAVCLRLAAEPEWAAELCQETYVRAWKKLGSFRAESAFTTWLHRLAVNVALDARRAALRRGLGEHTSETVEPPAPERDPGSGVDLERAVASLPAGARIVYVLHDVEGYTHAEIGEMTGVATGTSKAQLHRARRLLRKALSDDA
jgi:RNA polymerase sigma-70 factor (ECF subfamily)